MNNFKQTPANAEKTKANQKDAGPLPVKILAVGWGSSQRFESSPPI